MMLFKFSFCPLLVSLVLICCCCCYFNFAHAQNYGATCSSAGSITVGAGTVVLLDTPYFKSWWRAEYPSSACSGNFTDFNSYQQWAWYSMSAGSTSAVIISTFSDEGASAGAVDTIVWTSPDDCSSVVYCSSLNVGGYKSRILTGAISGTFRIAIGQFAASPSSAVDFPNGKTYIAQHCFSSCTACSALVGNVFFPNKPVPYTRYSNSASVTECGATMYTLQYYTFIAHSSGFLLVSTCPTDGATKTHTRKTFIAVYGSNCGSGVIACGTYPSHCPTSASVTLNVVQGTKYTVAIGSETLVYDGSGIPVFAICPADTFDHDNNPNTPCVACFSIPNCNVSADCTPAANFACLSCNAGYYVSGKECALCTPIPNCISAITCTTATNSVCTACSTGSYLNSQTCLPCTPIANCASLTCTFNLDSVCSACSHGYYLNNGFCSSCTLPANCASITPCTPTSDTVCAVCSSGFYLNNNGACLVCSSQPNCFSVTCSNSPISTCTICNGGYYINEGSCSICSPKPNCTSVTCTSGASSTCTACNSGSYLNSGSCSTCLAKPNCVTVTCNDGTASTCTSCQSGYYLNGGSCVACTAVEHCTSALTCTTALNSNCTSCDAGYLVSGGSCTTSCGNGTYVNGGFCTDCTPVSNCNSPLTCTNSGNSVCTSCNSGSYLSGGSCPSCLTIANCANLTCSDGTSSTCTACNTGFYLNGNSCLTCSVRSNCATVTCTNGDNTVCTSCNSGYYLSGTFCAACTVVSRCTSALTCSTSLDSVCTSCSSGYYVNSGSCTACTPVPNCNSPLTCSTSSNSVCTSCSSGYYLNSGSCSTCLAKSNCTSVACSNGISSTCTSCASGSSLSNGSCIPNNNNNNNNDVNNESASSSSVAPIAGAAGGGGFLLLLILLVLLIRKRNKNKNSSEEAIPMELDNVSPPPIPSRDSKVPLPPNTIITTSETKELPRRSPQPVRSTVRDSSISTNKSHLQYPDTSFPPNSAATATTTTISDNNRNSHYEVTAPIIPPKPSLLTSKFRTSLNPSVPVYDFATPYSKQVLSHSSIAKDLLIGKFLGEGNFGVVKLGKIPTFSVPSYCKDLLSQNTEDGYLLCAIKTLKDDSDEQFRQNFVSECQMMANFYHPNVIRVIAVLLDTSPSMLVTELMKYGDLKGILTKSENQSLFWNEKEFLYVLLQIGTGMEYLQSIKFIHRDLATRNCLVSDGLTVKISDFGFSKELTEGRNYYKLQKKGGRWPVKWMAPEAFGFTRFTHASDVWAFGVTMWEVFSYAHSPYGSLGVKEITAMLDRGERLECPSPCFSIPVVYEWMLKCWEYDPNSRPTFSEIVQFLSSQLNLPSVSAQEIRNIGEML